MIQIGCYKGSQDGGKLDIPFIQLPFDLQDGKSAAIDIIVEDTGGQTITLMGTLW